MFIDIPFEIGDKAVLRRKQLVESSIICPSCGGTRLIQTNKSECRLVGNQVVKEPFIIHCQNCGADGRVHFFSRWDVVEDEVEILSVYHYSDTDDEILYTVELNTGETRVVSSYYLKPVRKAYAI